jgi:ABC-type transport system substrate-binding protein
MHKRLFGLLASGAIVVAACGSPTASVAPSASAPPGSQPPASSAPPAGEQTLTMVMDGDVSGGLSNAADNVPTAEAVGLIYDAIYTYDAALTPQPNLADGPAEISDDGKVWTIKLKSGVKFHDGTDLDADDVIQTFQIAESKNCRYNPSICYSGLGLTAKMEKVDDQTVRWTLDQPLATFSTVVLPAIVIQSKDAVDASYEKYLQGTQQVTAAEVKAVLDAVDAEIKTPTGPAGADGKPTTNWDAHLTAMEEIITKAGQQLPDKADYPLEDGSLDKATYGTELRNRVNAVNQTFVGSEIDALAAAFPYLDFQLNPVGTGPFKFVSFKSGESIELAGFEEYHKGAPQISRLFIPIIKDDLAGGQALVAGQVDWKYSLEGATFNQIKDDPNLKFVEYPDFGFFGLYFNMHPEHDVLFKDINLRQAVAHCFDKKETVNAATEGQGVPIYSEIPPASWAYPSSGLNEYPYDPAKSKQLIEASGWQLGSDGIYAKDGRKLSTVVAVRAGRPNRSAFMQLLGDQVKECGIDITYKEVDFDALLTMLDNYPHVNAAAPETNRPYDAYFGGFGASFDPDPYSLYHSSQCSTAENPQTFNYECYQNPEVDKLIEDGLKTFDQAARATIYQEYAKLQAEDLPVLYAWSDIAREGLRATVDGTSGIELDTPTWFWELEKLTNIK